MDMIETVLNRVAHSIEMPAPSEDRRWGSGYDSSLQKFQLDIESAAASMVTQNAERVAGAIAAVVPAFVRAQIDVWPVRTGKSLESFEVVIPQKSGRLEVIIRNEAPYAYMIPWGRYNPDTPAGKEGKSVWGTLFRSQGMNLSKQIYDQFKYKHPRKHYDLWYRQRQRKAKMKAKT